MRTDYVCRYFDVSLRTIQRTISRFPNDFPEIVAALRLFHQIKMQQEDHERSMVVSHDIIFDRQPRLMKRLEKTRLILEIGHLKSKLKKTKLRLSNLEAKWRQNKFRIEEPSEASDLPGDHEEQSCVLQELVKLNQVHPQGRRYSQRLFRFVYCLLTYSPRCYKYWSRVWPRSWTGSWSWSSTRTWWMAWTGRWRHRVNTRENQWALHYLQQLFHLRLDAAEQQYAMHYFAFKAQYEWSCEHVHNQNPRWAHCCMWFV